MESRQTAPGAWQPPHCPNPKCKFHKPSAGRWRYVRRGHYWRHARPHRIARFTCRHCGRNFSRQTFCTTYWLKRPKLLPMVSKLAVGCMANRQIARALECAPATVDAMIARLGRHCLLFQASKNNQLSPRQDIVIDGLLSFEHSQYFPFELLIAVDRPSSFILGFAEAPLRRSGRMTEYQKRKRAHLEAIHGKPDPNAVRQSARQVLKQALKGASEAVVRSDEHTAYPLAMRDLDCEISHRRTSSKRRRNRANELFEVNSLDMFLRHSSSNHKRETIAFSKRRQAAVERFAIFMVWKNFIKRRFENQCRETPAMLVGLCRRLLKEKDVLARRLYPGLIEMPKKWLEYYWRRVRTPVLGVNREHRLKYAF